MRFLASQFTVTALLETHVGGADADLFFCRHVDGVRRLYSDGFAILVQYEWADFYKPVLSVVIPDAMMVLTWEASDTKYFLFIRRLDAHSEAKRREQLSQATRWARDRIHAGDWVAFAGDRNFVRLRDERQSSPQRQWMPSDGMNSAWQRWLHSICDSREVLQPEFTWGRVMSSQQSGSSWTHEVLDVVGSNGGESDGDPQFFSRRCDDIPHPRASDHWPVGLRWRDPEASKRGRKRPVDPIVKRSIPHWLLEDADFLAVMDSWFDEWCESQPHGMEAL